MNQSLKRAKELQEKTIDYLSFKQKESKKRKNLYIHYLKQKEHIMNYFDATLLDWNNWHWQVKHRITDLDTLRKFIHINASELQKLEGVVSKNRFAISPYYLALIQRGKADPIKALSVPSIEELIQEGEIDPMDESHTNPAGEITRRYPDRVIINVTNVCAMYCRHCQRRRLIGENDSHTKKSVLDQSIEYIKDNPEIRDVLLTGGDALLLCDDQLEDILMKLRNIPHVEIIRIGTRTPVTMPMRITHSLVEMLSKYHPIYVNTQFNHPNEVTKESKVACELLANNGMIIGNQAVLLKNINDDPFTMTYLNQLLLTIRVRPYYIFHAKNIIGTTHFIPSLETGLKIMEYMRGNTSGLAIPTYIMNAPGGLGKVPLLPDYIIEKSFNTYEIRTWENKVFTYEDK